MARETELKFLLRDDSWRMTATNPVRIIQTYLNPDPEATVRLRIAGDMAFLTVKSPNRGSERGEWEYEIPMNDAREMMAECTTTPVIDKTRWHDGRWEIDEYHGCLEGLVVAEIELHSPDEEISLPLYIGREVTGNPAYYNSTLALTGAIPT
ncbi:MAG: CYTH domain-containing protein [Paramuribaculum sp.]|nr:CYTH domain-containing protein [Paramuribaculum sp.]